jgi:hypothetical protein
MRLSAQALAATVARLAQTPGLRGCALVDAGAGLVWSAHGELAGRDGLWEAATDFWRLQMRNAEHFADLGEFGAAVMHHSAGMLAVFQCCRDPDLLFVAVGRQGGVDWVRLQLEVREFGRALGQPAEVVAEATQ